jgi:lipocalin-like protein
MENAMNRRHILSFSALTALLCAGVAFSAGPAPAQQKSLKEQLIGAWTAVSIESVQDGAKRQPYGPNPKGILIFDASGRYAQAQSRATRAKFKSASRRETTAEEGLAAMNDTLFHFGGWSVDEASKTILLRIEGSLISNAEGMDQQRRIISLTADELVFSNPQAVQAGNRVDQVYRRTR